MTNPGLTTSCRALATIGSIDGESLVARRALMGRPTVRRWLHFEHNNTGGNDYVERVAASLHERRPGRS